MKGETKNKVLLALVAVVPATLSGILSNCQARYESKLKAKAAEKKSVVNSNATIDSLRPAIVELQDIQETNSTWSREVDEELRAIGTDVDQLLNDVAYCKAYIDFATRGRFRERYVPDDRDGSALMSIVEDRASPAPKPKAKLPDNIDKARAYQGARQQMACAPGDPLCGAAALE